MAEKVTIGNCELWHGDCREVLPLLPKHDLLLTDPPYGIGEDGGRFRDRKGGGHRVLERMGWDSERPSAWVFGLMQEKADSVVIWGGNYFADLLPASKGWLYWNKLMGGDFSDGELAWTNLDRALRHFQYCNKEHGKEHPTQKPLPLMEWCLSFFPEAQTVLDPFMGSGTTGVACARMGLQFVGIERERKYFEIACERITRAYAQPRLFDDAKVGAGDTAVQGDMLLPANPTLGHENDFTEPRIAQRHPRTNPDPADQERPHDHCRDCLPSRSDAQAGAGQQQSGEA